ncbi:MAG: hypothetical protein U0Z44_09240 [Kouleothrix sp.]
MAEDPADLDDVMWQSRQQLKKQLVEFARERTRDRHLRLGTSPAVWPVLDENAFTIGFGTALRHL